MRIGKSFLLWVMLVGCVLAWRGRLWRDRLEMAWTTLRQAPAASDLSIGHTYVLGSEWLRFPIPQRADALRVLTNATIRRPLPPPNYADVRPGWRYQIEYRLVDEEGHVWRRSTHHFRGNIVQYLTPDSPEPVTTSRFNDPDLVPASSRRLHIPLARISQTVRHIHLRLVATDAEIEDVVVRLAGHSERRDYYEPGLWQRLSGWRKERLCRAVIYPPELLSLRQRKEVLRWHWRPVAPWGVEGHDYRRRVLFSNNHLQGVELESNYVPAGVLLRPGIRRIVRLPNVVGHVSIVGRPVAPALLASLPLTSSSSGQLPRPAPRQATVQWFDTRHELRASRRLAIRDQTASELQGDDPASTELAVEGGWLEITSREPISIRLFWRHEGSSDEPREFTPRLDIVRTYPCAERELRFDIAHVEGEPTPLRLTARQMLVEPFARQGGGALRWSFVDARGATLRSDVVAISAQPTEFDTASFRDPQARITDPLELFWQVPPEAKQFVVAAVDGNPLVNVAIRPIRLPRQVQVGTRGLAGLYSPVSPPLHAWFPLRPQRHRELLKYQKTAIVHLGIRPPEINPEVLAGNFRWEDFHPTGDWSGRFLLLPRIQDGQVRDEALANTYFEFPLGERSAVRVRSETDQPVNLSLAVVVTGTEASDVRVQLDDALAAELSSKALQTTLTIPGVTPGLHHIRIDGPASTRVFLNHTERLPSARYLKRLGIEVGGTAQTFRIEKVSAEPELLVLDFFFIDPTDNLTRPSAAAEREGEAPAEPYLTRPSAAAKREGEAPAEPYRSNIHTAFSSAGASPFRKLGSKNKLSRVGHTETVVLRAELQADDPSSAHSLLPMSAWKATSWEFYIEPPEATLPRGFVLGTSSQRVAVGRRCFLWLGENVRPGEHVLKIETNMDEPAYTVLSRVIPGQFPRRRILRVR